MNSANSAYENRENFYNLLNKVENYFTIDDIDKIFQAYIILLELVRNGKVKPIFITIQLEIAQILADYKISPNYLIASMLYYPIFLGTMTEKDIIPFGISVKNVSDDLLKIGKYIESDIKWGIYPVEKDPLKINKTNTKQKIDKWSKQTDENIPKMFMQIAKSDQAVIVKLVDRLVLLCYSKSLLTPEDSKLLALETQKIHSMIAEQLGIWSLKWQLDDMSFYILDPLSFNLISNDLNEKSEDRERIVKHAIDLVNNVLKTHNIKAEVNGRAKHIYGLYLKHKKDPLKSVSEINDNLGIRVIVKTEEDCYQVLSILFDRWVPVSGIYENGFTRDWIQNPKPNGYKSIHTTIYFSEESNRLLEVQIRTEEMHRIAEFGPAAHWYYKKQGQTQVMSEKDLKLSEEIMKLRKLYESRL